MCPYYLTEIDIVIKFLMHVFPSVGQTARHGTRRKKSTGSPLITHSTHFLANSPHILLAVSININDASIRKGTKAQFKNITCNLCIFCLGQQANKMG